MTTQPVHAPVLDPLTGDPRVRLLRTFDTERIRQDWTQEFGIDITTELGIHSQIQLYESETSALQFFRPGDITGSGELYRRLSSHGSYYMEEKWEHGVALQDLAKLRLASNVPEILEVGCGRGAFVRRLCAAGYRATGVEMSRDAVDKCRAAGVPVEEIDVCPLAEREPGRYDAVCSFQVLEHIAEPRPFLEALVRLLKPDGLLLLGVPNRDSFLRYQWCLLDMPPHHMTRWSALTMAKLECLFPLKLLRVLHEPLADYHIGIWVDVHMTRLRHIRGIGRLLANRFSRRATTTLLRAGLRKFAVGQTLYAAFRRHG